MFLEVKLFDLLPAGHDASASPQSDILPHGIEIPVVDDADVFGVICECGELIALGIMVVIGHCIGEPTDDGPGYVCEKSQHTT